MFKLLYKTLLISFMSCSLMTTNLVWAVETGTTTATNTSAKTGAQSAGADGLYRDENGVLKKKETNHIEGVKDNDMLASIVMLAVGVIGTRMAISYKPLTTDVMIAAGGAAAFIAGEVMSNIGFKKKIDDQTIEVTKSADGKSDQAQIERLQDLKKSYEEAKKTTKTKKTMQMTAAAAFAGAAAMAGYQAYKERAAMQACLTALKTHESTNTTCAEFPPLKAAAAASGGAAMTAAIAVKSACTKCAFDIETLSTLITTIEAARASPGPSVIEQTTIKPKELLADKYLTAACTPASPANTSTTAAKAAIIPACTAALKIESLNQIYSYPIKVTDYQSPYMKLFSPNDRRFSYELLQSRDISKSNTIINYFADLFIPGAEASWLPLLGLGGGAAASFLLISGGLATTIDLQMFVPFNRAIAFGGLAALSFLAAKSSDNQLKKIDENIAKIDAILKDMNSQGNGIKMQALQEQKLTNLGFNPNESIEMPKQNGQQIKTDCLTSSGTNQCQSMEQSLVSLPDFNGLPSSLKSIASSAAGVGDGLSGKTSISGSTLGKADALGNKANAINGLLKKTQQNLNDQLVKAGKKPVDFDNEHKKFIARLNRSAASALQGSGMSPMQMMAALGSAPIDASAMKPTEMSPVKKATAAIGGAGPSSGKGKDLNFDFKEEAAGAGEEAGAADEATSNEKYDIGENDINKDSNGNIFEIISDRYIKSGYPKLLEEEAPVKN